jgi:hypothetical protein
MQIRLSTALLAYGLEGPSASSTVDNLNPQGIHLRNPEIRPNKPSHLYAPVFRFWMAASENFRRPESV